MKKKKFLFLSNLDISCKRDVESRARRFLGVGTMRKVCSSSFSVQRRMVDLFVRCFGKV